MADTPRGAVICKSKYGATRQYAEWLGDKLKLPVFDPDTEFVRLMSYDYLLIGSSVYGGKLLISPWLDNHKQELKDKNIFFFVVSAVGADETDEQTKIIRNNLPPGLADHRRVYFLPGRLLLHRLTWKDRLALRLGVMRSANKMRLEEDGVDIRFLAEILQDVSKQYLTAGVL
ncbi:MAG: flavodoxin domain-containing protein [Ilumatobacteraceae bacterium]